MQITPAGAHPLALPACTLINDWVLCEWIVGFGNLNRDA